MTTDKNADISFGTLCFGGNTKPIIYCYRNTAPDTYFSATGGYTVVYLDLMDEINNLETILTLPSGLTSIESEAFAGLTSAEAVRIPDTVSEIAEDAFDNSNVIILATEGSYALQWAVEHDKPYFIE